MNHHRTYSATDTGAPATLGSAQPAGCIRHAKNPLAMAPRSGSRRVEAVHCACYCRRPLSELGTAANCFS